MRKKKGRKGYPESDGGLGFGIIIILIIVFLIGQFYFIPFIEEHEKSNAEQSTPLPYNTQ